MSLIPPAPATSFPEQKKLTEHEANEEAIRLVSFASRRMLLQVENTSQSKYCLYVHFVNETGQVEIVQNVAMHHDNGRDARTLINFVMCEMLLYVENADKIMDGQCVHSSFSALFNLVLSFSPVRSAVHDRLQNNDANEPGRSIYR